MKIWAKIHKNSNFTAYKGHLESTTVLSDSIQHAKSNGDVRGRVAIMVLEQKGDKKQSSAHSVQQTANLGIILKNSVILGDIEAQSLENSEIDSF